MVPEGDHPHRIPLPCRRLTISIVAAALVATACSGSATTPSNAAGATSRASISPAPVAVPSSKPSPAPLPGGRLVYAQFRGEVGTLFTANPDGTDVTQLLPTGTGELPRWSPTGGRISVVANKTEGHVFLAMLDPDGSNYVQFNYPDPTLNLGCFAWSPEGSRLACEGWDDTDPSRNGIYTVRSSDGGDLIRVTTSPDGAHDIPTDYSPDGHQIVFTRGKPQDEGKYDKMMVVNVDGSGVRALSDQKLGQGRWSPDGKTILSDGDGKLLLVPGDGGQIRTIEIVSDGSLKTAFFASWSPDGEWIVFSGKASMSVDLYIVRRDGTDLHQVTDTPIGLYEDAANWTAAAR
jgi:Tol biopolymer transport system component